MTRPIRLIMQRTKRDCSVACLASITGQSYEKALMAFKHPVYDQGANNRQIQEAAKRLGFTTQWSRKIDKENDQGLLSVGFDHPNAANCDHMVLLVNGHIIDLEDPASLWDVDDYLEALKARILSIIKLV